MASKLYIVLLIAVGLINFVPVLGLISLNKINLAYGLSVSSIDLELLLRHRALMFGIIGGFVLWSVWVPTLQYAALTLAGISMLGFVLLALSLGSVNAELMKIMWADIIGLLLLTIAIVLRNIYPS